MPAPAPWPVSQDVSALAGRLLSHAESCPRAGLRDLAAALLRIHPVAAAVQRQHGPAPAAWLLDLKDAVAEAEDLLDELLLLRRHRQVRSVLSSCVTLGSIPSREELRRLVGRLGRIHDDGSERLVGAGVRSDETGHGVRSPNRVTGSVLAERKVFGREEECGEMLRWLVGGSDEGCCSAAPVASILGHGGMGKTAVAQCVYNDERIERHFDLRAWVCVWDRSDEAELTREILQSIGGADDKLCGDGSAGLESLQEKLEGFVASKRFLLVLDDVWNDEGKTELENRSMWKKVLAPLRSASSGSRILVTTRMRLAAEILNAKHVISVDGLGISSCWLLLKEAALGGESMDVPPDLQEIGRAIAAKVKGSPLSAKALGQMMRNARTARRWRTLLDTEVGDHIIISSLQLSYQHLPGHLQRCFSYCSIFPRNWRFDRDKLVQIWVALGFIQPSRDEDKMMEDLGQEYFDDLQSRSFFQTVNKNHQTYYFLDDLMHDLAQHFSVHDCVKVNDRVPIVIPPTVRHLSVSTDYLLQLKSKCRLGRLQTLLVLRSSSLSSSHLPSKFLAELKNLRVLNLSESDIVELPETISQLVHLRYLALSCITNKLPKCIYRLSHLEVLDMPLLLFRCSHPGSIGKLVKIKYIETCYRQDVDEIRGWCLIRVEFHSSKDTVLSARNKPVKLIA